ncbi:MAG: Holliday junction resolvase RuvX [bacterium]
MIVCGVDYGTKKIGLAFSDDSGTISFPYGIIKSDKSAKDVLIALAKEKNVGAFVFGKSLNMNGEDNAVTERIQSFAKEIETTTNLPVHFVIESFSSMHARGNTGKEMFTARKEKKQNNDLADAEAASIILQRYLETIKQ